MMKRGLSGGGQRFLKGGSVVKQGAVWGCAISRGGGGGSRPDRQAAGGAGVGADGRHMVGTEARAGVTDESARAP
jgi:hypothetical protein